MGVYRPPSVEEQPKVVMTSWTVMRVDGKDDHLVGYIGVEGQGRVSSKVMKRSGRIITTRSGREYLLEGDPSFHHEAQYVWSIWSRYNDVNSAEAKDVSSEYA